MISSEDRILTNQLLIEDLELEEEFTEKSLKDNIQLMKYYRLISQQIDDTLRDKYDELIDKYYRKYADEDRRDKV